MHLAAETRAQSLRIVRGPLQQSPYRADDRRWPKVRGTRDEGRDVGDGGDARFSVQVVRADLVGIRSRIRTYIQRYTSSK